MLKQKAAQGSAAAAKTALTSSLFLGLMPLLCAAAEEPPPVPQPGEVSAWPMVLVALTFVVMIGGFVMYIWAKERKRKTAESE